MLEMEDDGRGFDVRQAEERRPGMGCSRMRERMGLVNGRLEVPARRARDAVVATVPLTVEEHLMTDRVVLVDDHAIVRTGLRAVLGAAPEIEVVGEARAATRRWRCSRGNAPMSW